MFVPFNDLLKHRKTIYLPLVSRLAPPHTHAHTIVCVCVCVCVGEREREREKKYIKKKKIFKYILKREALALFLCSEKKIYQKTLRSPDMHHHHHHHYVCVCVCGVFR